MSWPTVRLSVRSMGHSRPTGAVGSFVGIGKAGMETAETLLADSVHVVAAAVTVCFADMAGSCQIEHLRSQCLLVREQWEA